MNLYPLDLVLAVSLAWATVFTGALPTRLLRAPVLTRLPGLCGGVWIVVATAVPGAVVHFYVIIALLCLYAWRQLRHDHSLSGKGWLLIAAGLGISLGPLLILAETPGAFPQDAAPPAQLALLISIYLGGAIIGLALVLHYATRRAATAAGIPVVTVHRYANLILALTLARSGLLILIAVSSNVLSPSAVQLTMGASLLILPLLAWLARRRSISPQPSTSGPALICLLAVALAMEMTSRLLPHPL